MLQSDNFLANVSIGFRNCDFNFKVINLVAGVWGVLSATKLSLASGHNAPLSMMSSCLERIFNMGLLCFLVSVAKFLVALMLMFYFLIQYIAYFPFQHSIAIRLFNQPTKHQFEVGLTSVRKCPRYICSNRKFTVAVKKQSHI